MAVVWLTPGAVKRVDPSKPHRSVMGSVSGDGKQNLAFAIMNSVLSARPFAGRAACAPPDAV
jgi:hypothetical protein